MAYVKGVQLVSELTAKIVLLQDYETKTELNWTKTELNWTQLIRFGFQQNVKTLFFSSLTNLVPNA